MKTYLLAAGLLLAAPTTIYAQDKDPKPSLKALDEKNGFRTHHFGDDFSQFSDLKLDEDGGDTKFYTNTNESLKIGGAEIKEISYGFYKGKFYAVFISTSSLTDSRALLEALEAQYGRPYQSNQYIKDYDWFGKVVTMNYKENSVSGSGRVYMFSQPIADQKQADKKEAAKKAASDL